MRKRKTKMLKSWPTSSGEGGAPPSSFGRERGGAPEEPEARYSLPFSPSQASRPPIPEAGVLGAKVVGLSLEAGVLGLEVAEALRDIGAKIRLGLWRSAERRLTRARLGRCQHLTRSLARGLDRLCRHRGIALLVPKDALALAARHVVRTDGAVAAALHVLVPCHALALAALLEALTGGAVAAALLVPCNAHPVAAGLVRPALHGHGLRRDADKNRGIEQHLEHLA
eukprot:scaffold37644_cov67-Phaeocystis_antarctica.AAC.2